MTVDVVGRGLLADLLRHKFATSPPSLEASRAGVHVRASDGAAYGLDDLQRAPTGHADLWVCVEPGAIVIGPLEGEDIAGCLRCVERRRANASGWARADEAARRIHRSDLAARQRLLTPLAADLASVFVRSMIETMDDGVVVRLDLRSMRASRHRFLADPLCEKCAPVVPDVPLRGTPVESAAQEWQKGTLRGVDALSRYESWRAAIVDSNYGLVTDVSVRGVGDDAIVTARLAERHQMREAGYGRAGDARAAEATALLEALERFAGAAGERREFVTASFNQLGHDAVDPRTLGTHDDASYADPQFGFRQFDPDQEIRWAWGWSLSRDRPVLVPLSIAYWATESDDPDGTGFAFETSNGCAIGSTVAEATLYALLEVVERDAFLATWYARRRVPEIQFEDLRGTDAARSIAALKARTGYSVRAFDTTLEHGIPSVWVIAHSDAVGLPATVSAAGAHVDGSRAINAALKELSPLLLTQIERYRAPAYATRAHELAQDPTAVRTMEDHSHAFCDPLAAGRLRFLLEPSSEGVERVTVRGAVSGTSTSSISHAATALTTRLIDAGMEVIIVDQTPPEVRRLELRVVRAIVPGMLQMTFGHQYRRTAGLPRLRRMLLEQGLDAPVDYPHPFP